MTPMKPRESAGAPTRRAGDLHSNRAIGEIRAGHNRQRGFIGSLMIRQRVQVQCAASAIRCDLGSPVDNFETIQSVQPDGRHRESFRLQKRPDDAHESKCANKYQEFSFKRLPPNVPMPELI